MYDREILDATYRELCDVIHNYGRLACPDPIEDSWRHNVLALLCLSILVRGDTGIA